jgi:hypothetical protein
LLIGLTLPIAGCGKKGILSFLSTRGTDIASINVVPGSQAVATVNQTGQFIAIGTGAAGATQNLTKLVTWKSSDPEVASINDAGLATALKPGTAMISATAENADGSSVTGGGSFVVTGITSEPLLSLAILPASQTVNLVNETGQFIAVGTFLSAGSAKSLSVCKSTGFVQDCTDYVTWSSSDIGVGEIDSKGLATGLSAGTTAITAIGKNPDGTLVTAAATFTENAIGQEPEFANIQVETIGLDPKIGTITAYLYNNVTHTTSGPALIDGNCPITAYVNGCSAALPIGSWVQLTATPKGVDFGGWSANCDTAPDTPNTTSQCTIQMTGGGAAVEAIFN